MTLPAKYVALPCPCCGRPRRALNGRWLAALRKRAGVDQRAVGRAIGVSGPYISDIERNRRDVPVDVVPVYLALRAKEN